MKNSIFSVLSCKCPRCREGKMFKYKLGTNPIKFMEMSKTCPVCGLDLEQEEGYYYGAMFVSYAFAMMELAVVLIAVKLISGSSLSIETIMIVLTAVYLILAPVNFRWGRAGWLALFFRYNKNAKKAQF